MHRLGLTLRSLLSVAALCGATFACGSDPGPDNGPLGNAGASSVGSAGARLRPTPSRSSSTSSRNWSTSGTRSRATRLTRTARRCRAARRATATTSITRILVASWQALSVSHDGGCAWSMLLADLSIVDADVGEIHASVQPRQRAHSPPGPEPAPAGQRCWPG